MKHYCENCGRKLIDSKIVWLELSNTDSEYYLEIPEGHISQGLFAFGPDCAKNEIKNN